MANQFLRAQEYANTMLLLVKNQLVMGRLVNGRFENKLTDENGLSISVKRPPRFVAQNGATLAAQDIVTGSETVTLDQYKNVHISVGDLEYVQDFNALMRNSTMQSAASTLAHAIEGHLQDRLLDFPNWVGDPGQLIHSSAEFTPVHTRLMRMGVPNASLSAVLDFEDGEKIRGQLLAVDNSDINRPALEKVRIPIMSEITPYATQSLPMLTVGTRTASGASQVDGASQNVNYRSVKTNEGVSQTLDLKNLTSGHTIKRGEVFSIANVYAWDNRAQPGKAQPHLQQFTVLEDATADGSGDVTVTISPAIIVPGTNDGVGTITNTAFATVNAAPADSAAVTWMGVASTGYVQRAAFHKDAITLVSAKLHMPFTGVASFATDPETGISIRYWRGSDIATGNHIHRWDTIFGSHTMDRQLGARINGLTP